MTLECWYYVAGIASAVIGLVGLIALIIYAADTRKIRLAAEDQLEGLTKPCVVLMANPDQTAGFDDSRLVLKNVGSGVALNGRYQMSKNKGGPWIELPALEVGGIEESHMYIKHLLDADPLVCEFESLSSTRYRTESYVSKLTTNLDLRHRFQKI